MAKAEDKNKKDDKAKGEGKEAKAEEAASKEEAPESAGKKRKLVLWGGLGVIVSSALAVGGFFVKKTFLGGNDKSMAAHAADAPAEDAHGDKKDDGHGDKKDDGHGDKKDDGHGDKKDDGHGDKKDDGHGDKKDDGHGDKKDDGHGDKKDDGHGDKKDDGHGDKKDDGHGDKKDDGHGDAAKEKAKAEGKAGKASEFGQTFEIPRMDLNLGNPLENRYLRVGISLRHFGGEPQQEELKTKLPQIKDIVISMFGSKSRGEILSAAGKEAVRKQLKRELNEVLEKPVHSVYFTEFFVE